MLLAEVSGFGAGFIELAGSVLALVLSGLAVGVYRSFAKKAKWDTNDRIEAAIRTAVSAAVNATEQYAKRKWGDQVDKGAEKLSLAKQLAKINLKKHGVEIDAAELEGAIEAEVGIINSLGGFAGKLGDALSD